MERIIISIWNNTKEGVSVKFPDTLKDVEIEIRNYTATAVNHDKVDDYGTYYGGVWSWEDNEN